MKYILQYLRFSLIFGCILTGSAAMLEAQVPNKVIQFAENWTNASTTSIQVLSDNQAPATLYLAQFEPKGFLLYFFDGEEPEILGYSFENHFPTNSEHPLIHEWIPNMAPSTLSGREKSTKGISLMQDAMVEPLIVSKWGQGHPWNKYCPGDDENKAQVGCVAVAMGQIMKKWNWPVKGIGSKSYVPTNYPAYGTVSANFDTTYAWGDMDATAPSEAAALLLYHAGVASFMNYGPNESGANTSVNAPNALMDHFSYNKGMQVREKGRYLESDWFKMLRQELINGRPVIYRGVDPDGGAAHAFNIDGFHSNEYFHFNWGWNGIGNGYFRLENMGAGGANFTDGQAAIFWIQPDHLPMHDRPASADAIPGDGFVQLMWEDLTINDFSHFNIYRDGELVGSTWENRYRDNAVENGVEYLYQITANYIGSGTGESVPTDSIFVTPWPQLYLPFNHGMEGDMNGWEFKGNAKGFQWGSAAELGIPGNSGHLVAIRSDLAGKEEQVRDYFISPTLDLRGKEHVAIKFDYVFKQKPGVDYLFLMYRRYDNGLWYPVSKLSATGDWADWSTNYFYLPDGAKNTLIQLGFYYNDFNGQGYGAAIDNIEVWQIDAPPIPEFSVSQHASCAENTITFNSESSGNIQTWYWDFGEGAVPQFAVDEGPHHVIYTTAGSKTVSLLLNHLDLELKKNLVAITPKPIAGFDYSTSGLLASFQDSSKNGETYFWNFGDGNTATERNPENKYHQFEIFEVYQVVYNSMCDPDTSFLMLDLRKNTSIDFQYDLSDVNVYPNPMSEFIMIQGNSALVATLQVEILDLQGRCLLKQDLSDRFSNTIAVQHLPAGICIVKLSNNKYHKYFRILKY